MVKINGGGLKRNITGIHANFRSQRSPLSTQTGGANNGSEDLVTHMVTRYAGPHLEHRAGEITPLLHEGTAISLIQTNGGGS